MPRQVRSGSTRSTPEAASSAAASANPGSMRKRSTRSARGASGMRAIALLGLLLSPAVVPLRINTALRPLCRKHASASHALVMQIRDQPNRDVVATKEQTAQKATASMAQAEATTRNATLTKATNSSLGGANPLVTYLGPAALALVTVAAVGFLIRDECIRRETLREANETIEASRTKQESCRKTTRIVETIERLATDLLWAGVVYAGVTTPLMGEVVAPQAVLTASVVILSVVAAQAKATAGELKSDANKRIQKEADAVMKIRITSMQRRVQLVAFFGFLLYLIQGVLAEGFGEAFGATLITTWGLMGK